MVVRVWQQVWQARRVDAVVIATEDQEIIDAAAPYGAACVFTRPCQNGTERVCLAAAGRGASVVVNVQGDEPLIHPAHIDAVIAGVLAGADIATASTPLEGDPANPARVKVVVNQAGEALYFSRQPIPTAGPWRLHLGLYAFAAASLPRILSLPPSPLEQSERLEQLRWLEAGLRIAVVPLGSSEPGVDTPEDLERVRQRWAELKIEPVR